MDLKLTRHNGRTGKNGTYNPKHNDRRFDAQSSEHIDTERTRQNIYWDCYAGFSSELVRDKDNDYSFEKIEQIYYFEHYADHVCAQNERNAKNRHTERNRTVEDLLKNSKTCPEESIYQIGTIEESISGELLAKISAEFFAEMEEKFGSHVHILDWALHMDEGTPHIHERHVFDCENKYGELCPQQEKALEELGIPLPNPDKKKGRNNNRKQTFDAECRKMLFRICTKHSLHLQTEPTYGGRGYMEKQDFIVAKQAEKISAQREILMRNTENIERQEKKIGNAKKEISEKEKTIVKQKQEIAVQKRVLSEKQFVLAEVTMRLADMESLVDEVAGQAYEKACEVVTDSVRRETQKEDIKVINEYAEWLSMPERNADQNVRMYAVARLEKLEEKLLKSAKGIGETITKALQKPERKKEHMEQVKSTARSSLKAQLSAKQKRVDDYKSQHYGENIRRTDKGYHL